MVLGLARGEREIRNGEGVEHEGLWLSQGVTSVQKNVPKLKLLRRKAEVNGTARGGEEDRKRTLALTISKAIKLLILLKYLIQAKIFSFVEYPPSNELEVEISNSPELRSDHP